MCKRKSADKKRNQHGMYIIIKKNKEETSTGCMRETPQIKMTPARMCKRNSPDKSEGNTGCVRETTHIKTKSAWDV